MTADRRSLLRSIPSRAEEPPGLDVSTAPDSPVDLFERWLREAIAVGCAIPHAATLATTGPDARTLILKDVTEDGFWFATRTDGPKAEQLHGDADAVLVFFWREQYRQVRVHGRVRFAGADVSAADFRERPAHSRATVLLGRQSSPLPRDVDYSAAFTEAKAIAAADPEAGMERWAAAVLDPVRVEFWASTPSDAPVRLQYRRSGDEWAHEPLWP